MCNFLSGEWVFLVVGEGVLVVLGWLVLGLGVVDDCGGLICRLIVLLNFVKFFEVRVVVLFE